MEIIPQFLLVIVLVFLNGFFVASEFALVAVRKTRIDELVLKGNRSAKLVQKAIKNLDTFISATQLGITLASLGLGWVGEPIIARFLESFLMDALPQDLVFLSAHGVAIVIAFSIITFLHIVLGELAPKSIALQKAEFTSLLIIAPLSLFTTIFKPFIYILNGAGILVLKLVGFKAPSGHQLVHSEEEIKMILAQSAKEGAIEKEEAEMVYSVLKLGDIPVRKIMVPRTKVVAFDKNTPLKDVISVSQNNPHSRFPVYHKSIDSIVGFIHIKDIYKSLISKSETSLVKDLYKKFLATNGDIKLSEMGIIREIPKFSENKRIDDILVNLKRKRTHIAVVNDEFSGTAGIVTLEDVVESLVGEIHDEFEIAEKPILKKEILKKLKLLAKN